MPRISKVTAVIVFLSLFLLSSVYSADETITITTYYPSPTGSYRELRWGDGVSILQPDQGGSIEVGGLYGGSPSTPYIDFHRDNTAFPAGDYDGRIILSDADTLEIMGARLKADNVPGCVKKSYSATSGNCPCGDWNCDGDYFDSVLGLDGVTVIRENSNYYLSFKLAVGATYATSGWYLCCQAKELT